MNVYFPVYNTKTMMQTALLLLLAFCFLFAGKKSRELFEKFTHVQTEVKATPIVTYHPPTLSEKTPHWDHNYAEKSRLGGSHVHSHIWVNYFPMEKPPSTWEDTMKGPVDISRAQFVPKFAKRRQSQ
jgi:hypothetical protein